MAIFSSKSIGSYIVSIMGVFSLTLLTLCYLLLAKLDWESWNIAICLVIITLFLSAFSWHFRNKIVASFDRALLHIEAVKMEDYNQFSKSDFDTGVTALLHNELASLSKQLQLHKSQYDQHALLLYQLIDQLDTPMLVFNQRQLLTYANSAFSLLYDDPWQVYRLASPRLLGLEKQNGQWKINKSDQNWQINQSEFIDAGERHLLLVFTNIDSALRASQLNAWQQIIRVLGHEIRNSLTPVSSLAESLSNKCNVARDKQALEVISERCRHLQDFVARYSSLSQKLQLDIQVIPIDTITHKLTTLFPRNVIRFNTDVSSITADPTFIEQIFINLIKNAFEANATQVEVNFKAQKGSVAIDILDDGHGISNPDNLFVPLYTTKPQGQGIGLTFCRNIIEQHKGSISIANRKSPHSGTCITVTLPAIP